MQVKLPGNAWQVAFTYVGTLIGAGFASGQEIFKFFAVYGKWGRIGTLAAGGMFAVMGYLIIKTSSFYGMESYNQYITYLFGGRKAKIIDGIVLLFLFAGLTVMLIASGTLLSGMFVCPLWWGFILTMFFISGVLLTGVQGILRLNTVLVPILLAVLLAVVFISMGLPPNNRDLTIYQPGLLGGNWLVAAIIYVAYNLVLGTVILASLGKTAQGGGARGAILGGFILGLVLALSCNALIHQGGLAAEKDMPMLELANNINELAGKLYIVVLWMAIITTALSNAYGVLVRIASWGKIPRPLAIVVIFLPSFLFMEWPFAKAVETIYPLLGYLGAALLVAIIVKSSKNKDV